MAEQNKPCNQNLLNRNIAQILVCLFIKQLPESFAAYDAKWLVHWYCTLSGKRALEILTVYTQGTIHIIIASTFCLKGEDFKEIIQAPVQPRLNKLATKGHKQVHFSDELF